MSFKAQITTLFRKITSKNKKEFDMRTDRTFSDTGGDLSSDENTNELKDVHKAVMREYREIKLSIGKNEYPLDLKKTVHLLSGGYMDVVKHEQ